MTPEEGWHGYWSNPGDAGYGMRARLVLAAWVGARASRAIRCRRPLLISGLMNHVYEGPYAVLVPVAVPQDAAPGSRIPVTIEAEWLACTDEICVPERATLAATVAVGESGQVDPRFDHWRAAIAPLLDRRAQFALTGDRLRIAIPLPASFEIAAPHLFLSDHGLIDYAAPQVFRREGDVLVAELPLRRRCQSRPARFPES